MSAGSDETEGVLDVPVSLWSRRRPRPSPERDEASLVREAQAGDPDAIEALIRGHWDRAHRAAFLITRDTTAAEDIAQESMLAAVRAIDGFDRRRPFRPWLHRIVVNRALDYVRARERRAEVSADSARVEVAAPEPAANPGLGGLGAELMDALADLDADQRATVVLRHVLDYSGAEIARMLGMPPPTVRTRLRRALERLRKVVDDDWTGGSDES